MPLGSFVHLQGLLLCVVLFFSKHSNYLGEFFDLEKLSQTCAEMGRYTFFFSSWPLNM